MALVAYDSSGESETEEQKSSLSTKPKSKASSSKPTFQKLVDSSNPNKIKINLSSQASHNDSSDHHDEPPAKKAKTGPGAFKDFNSFLPAPKRPAAANRGGLGKGVNLKTGATPGFTREPMPVLQASSNDDLQHGAQEGERERDGLPNELSASVSGRPSEAVNANAEQSTKKATMFKPLSVARKPQKKKPPLAQESEAQKSSPKTVTDARSAPPKISLFGTHANIGAGSEKISEKSQNGAYTPMLFQAQTEIQGPAFPDSQSYPSMPATEASGEEGVASASGQDQSLDAVASSLNLTPSQKRQLFGRNGAKSSAQAIQVTNFSTDAEYAANEEMRQSGEVVQHQAVRPIAGGGKHSLKQLVSSAVGQKDALDEKFAEGSRNRKEGAGRYGW